MKSQNTFLHLFCQGIAPKNFACNAGKIFRALDNDVKPKSKHTRSDTSLRALITKHSLRYTLIHPKQERVETNGDGVERPCMRKCSNSDTIVRV